MINVTMEKDEHDNENDDEYDNECNKLDDEHNDEYDADDEAGESDRPRARSGQM